MLTPIKRRIVEFFRTHPHAVETIRGMSTWLSLPPSALEKAVHDLVGRKWLVAHTAGPMTGYALTRDAKILSQMEEALGGG